MPNQPALLTRIDLRAHAKTIVLIFLTCLGYSLLFWSGHHYSIDGIVMFENAKAILFQHSFRMNPPVVWRDPIATSIWPIGQTLAYIPVLFFLSTTILRGQSIIREIPYQPSNPYNPLLMANRAYHYASLTMPAITALTAGFVYILGVQLGLSRKLAAGAALVFGLASPAAVYARFDYAQPLATCLLLLAIIVAIQLANRRYTGLLAAGCCLGAALLTRPETLFYGGPALLMIVILTASPDKQTDRLISVSRVFLLLLTIASFLLINQAINTVRFGSPLAVGYQAATGNRFVFDLAHITKALMGNLLSPGRGLFVFFPISILSLWGTVQVWRQSPRIALALGSIPCLALLIYSAWSEWGAGISWGPRFLIPVFPYISLLAFFGLIQQTCIPRWLWKGVAAALILAGWVISLQGQLFNFLSFYASRNLSDPEIIYGDYNFLWQNSPILAGWRWGLAHPMIDSYGIQMLANGSLRAALWIGAIILGLAILLVVWMVYFKQPENLVDL